MIRRARECRRSSTSRRPSAAGPAAVRLPPASTLSDRLRVLLRRQREAAWIAVLSAGVWLSIPGTPGTRAQPAGERAFECSSLLAVGTPEWPARRGWTRAFLSVSDEGPVQECLGLMVQSCNGDSWALHRLAARRVGAASDDAEALARHDGWIYVFGSHFGRKDGPLRKERHFVARFPEAELDAAVDGKPLTITVASDAFRLHRLLNDALHRSGIALLPRGEGEADAFIRATRRAGGDEAGQVREDDRVLNIEGAAFEPAGTVLLGFRYPVTAEGHPLLVRVENPAALFRNAPEALSVTAIWTLGNVGTRDAPAGIRALAWHAGELHVLTGDLDSKPDRSALLRDHPEGNRAFSAHHAIEWPVRPGRVDAGLRHAFPDARDVEGIAFDSTGRPHYVRDGRREVPFTGAGKEGEKKR